MEALALELANILKITIEQATILVPVLKSQFLAYKIIETISLPVTVVAFFSGAATAALGLMAFLSKDDMDWNGKPSEEFLNLKKMLGVTWKVSLVLTILSIGSSILSYTLAPDFMFIREFLVR